MEVEVGGKQAAEVELWGGAQLQSTHLVGCNARHSGGCESKPACYTSAEAVPELPVPTPGEAMW